MNVADELPHLFIGQAGERRHLRAGHARANRVKNIGVFAAVRECRCIECRAAVALTGRTVTRLARLVVHALAVGNRRRIRRERISDGVRLVLLCEEHAGAECERCERDELDSTIHDTTPSQITSWGTKRD